MIRGYSPASEDPGIRLRAKCQNIFPEAYGAKALYNLYKISLFFHKEPQSSRICRERPVFDVRLFL